MFTDEKSERYLYFKFERTEIGGGAAQVLNFYAPYWMVNQTGLDLGYRVRESCLWRGLSLSFRLCSCICMLPPSYSYLCCLPRPPEGVHAADPASDSDSLQTHSYTFEAIHPASEPGPRMFAYDYYGTKNTCEMRVGADGAWGLGMRLDATGLPTGYICKVGEREYHVSTVNQARNP